MLAKKEKEELISKLRFGYLYTFTTPADPEDPNERTITISSGAGGAKLIMAAMGHKGITKEQIEEKIHVRADDGKDYPLSEINVEKKDNFVE